MRTEEEIRERLRFARLMEKSALAHLNIDEYSIAETERFHVADTTIRNLVWVLNDKDGEK